MIEARQEQEPILQRACRKLPDVDYVIALLGSKPSKSVQFQVSGTGSSIYAERSDAPKVPRAMPMQTLDDVVARFNRPVPPLFLKLDIQGGELECLRGGKATLLKSEVIQLEIALLNYNEGAPQAAETIEFMDAQGFSIFDVAGFVRPNGINLVQIDVIFVAKTSKLRPDFFRFDSSHG
jgi:FkbM family methyltransferase